jgi:hypothetical protein
MIDYAGKNINKLNFSGNIYLIENFQDQILSNNSNDKISTFDNIRVFLNGFDPIFFFGDTNKVLLDICEKRIKADIETDGGIKIQIKPNFKIQISSKLISLARNKSHDRLVFVFVKFFALFLQEKDGKNFITASIVVNEKSEADLKTKLINFCYAWPSVLAIMGGLEIIALKGFQIFGTNKTDQNQLKYKDCANADYNVAIQSFIEVILYNLGKGFSLLKNNKAPITSDEMDLSIYKYRIKCIIDAGENLCMLGWARNEKIKNNNCSIAILETIKNSPTSVQPAESFNLSVVSKIPEVLLVVTGKRGGESVIIKYSIINIIV